MISTIIMLSGKTPEALNRRVQQFHAWLKTHRNTYSLQEISYTLCMYREHFNHRFAMVIESVETCLDALDKLNLLNKTSDCFIRNAVNPAEPLQPLFLETLEKIYHDLSNPDIEKEKYKQKILALADLYTKGYTIKPEILYQQKYKPVPIPAYPF